MLSASTTTRRSLWSSTLPETETVTLRDIARLAGNVTAPAVANWRKRFDDFPQPIAKDGRQPLFNRDEVITWLTDNGKAVDTTDTDDSAIALVANLLRNSDLDAVTQLGLALNDHNPKIAITPAHERFRDEINRLNSRFSAADVLDALIDRLIHSSGRRFDSYRAPTRLSQLIARISDTPEHAILYDPCAGLGSPLSAAATPTSALHGQELVPEIAAAARQLLAKQNLHANIVVGDTIREDKLADVIADRVLAVPPLNVRLDDDAINDSDPRWTLRRPKKYDVDSAFIQIALAHLAPNGRAIVHTAPSTLHSRNDVLESLMRSNQLDAVIMLPAGLAPGANIESCLLVIDRQRPPHTVEQQTPVLLVELNDDKTVRNDISEAFLEDVTDIWGRWDHTPIDTSHAQTVTLAEVQQNDFNLTPSRYIKRMVWPRKLDQLDDQDEPENHFQPWVEMAILSSTAPSIDEPNMKITLSEPAVLTALQALKQQQIIEVIRGEANPRNETSDAVITAIEQLDISPRADQAPPDSADTTTTREGDLIIGMRAISADTSQRRVAWINADWAGREVSRDFVIIRVLDTESLGRRYLQFWLESPVFDAHLDRYVRSGPAQRISSKDLMAFEIPMVQYSEQRAAIITVFRNRKLLQEMRVWAERVVAAAEDLDKVSIEYAAAQLLEEPHYSRELRKEGEKLISEIMSGNETPPDQESRG